MFRLSELKKEIVVDETEIQEEDEESDFSLTNFLLSWVVPEEEAPEDEDIDSGFIFLDEFCNIACFRNIR